MNDLINRAEAIEAIQNTDWYHQNQNKDMVSGANDDEHQAWYKAQDIYKALEAVPSADRPTDGDLISRADAIEALGEEPPVWCDEEYEIAERNQWRADIEAIKSVPSAVRPIDGDLISRQAAIDALYDKGSSMTAWGELLAMKWSDIQKCIEQLPSADRPRGEWIDEDGTYYANCSKCGYQMDTHEERGYHNFCPNCGADMRGGTK